MTILSIETSCDETSVALVKSDNNSLTILSQTTATSLSLHAATGGIIPETAAREQLSYILPVLKETLLKGLSYDNEDTSTPPAIDAIAVTYGPGLIGSLLVGIETARILSYLWDKPLIPVNHLFGHIYANWLRAESRERRGEKTERLSALRPMPYAEVAFPAIALVVSGGHTDLVLMKSHEDIRLLGGTRDDAAGEAFDKVGRLLSLPYPAGPIIEERARLGNPKTILFPRPLIGEKTYDFSFSGLKTAVLRHTKTIEHYDDKTVNDICASMQQAVIDVLVNKTLKAANEYNVKSILLSGGVAANQTLFNQFRVQSSKFKVALFVPKKELCTDNAAMIAAAAYFQNKPIPWQEITVNPQLYFT